LGIRGKKKRDRKKTAPDRERPYIEKICCKPNERVRNVQQRGCGGKVERSMGEGRNLGNGDKLRSNAEARKGNDSDTKIYLEVITTRAKRWTWKGRGTSR